jgi:hypothetical protein
MKLRSSGMTLLNHTIRKLVAIVCAVLLIPGDMPLHAWSPQAAAPEEAAKIPGDQLDSLVAPIALYPDPLLSQTLVACTYPLEIIQLQQWLDKNKNLKGKELTDAVMKQNWDASIQAMAQFPDLVKLLSENIKWTTDLGNAFLAQQNDVMDAVQRMRKKAEDKGNLKTTEQQKVETKVVESKQVIVIQPASPEVVYVPSYNPTVVYGAPVYAYPPVAYPSTGEVVAGMALSFGMGVMMGAAFSGGWGWNCGWGGNNNVYVNHNNNFVNNSNRNFQGGNRANIQGGARGSGNTWQHNPQHRGGAPYSNRATANRFGGTTRGDSMASRQASARQAQGQRGGGLQDRGAGARQQPTAMDRSADRAGGDRVGNRSTSGGLGGGDRSAFGGAGRDSGSAARASSQRGASSLGGGGSRGGGGGRRR